MPSAPGAPAMREITRRAMRAPDRDCELRLARASVAPERTRSTPGIPDALPRAGRSRQTARTFARRIEMLDIVLVATTVAFFAVSLAYVRGCDRL